MSATETPEGMKEGSPVCVTAVQKSELSETQTQLSESTAVRNQSCQKSELSEIRDEGQFARKCDSF